MSSLECWKGCALNFVPTICHYQVRCVTLGKSHNLSGPYYSHLLRRNKNIYFMGSCKALITAPGKNQVPLLFLFLFVFLFVLRREQDLRHMYTF